MSCWRMRSIASVSKCGLLSASFEHLCGLVAVGGQRFEVAVEGVLGFVVAHAHGEILHALLELT